MTGEPLILPEYKGKIHPDYNRPIFLQALTGIESLEERPDARILHQGKNRLTGVSWQVAPDQTADLAIKRFQPAGFNKFKSFFIRSKARKAWNGAVALMEKGIGTPKPIFFLEKRKRGFLERGYFAAEYMADVTEVRTLFTGLPAPELEKLLEDLAPCISRCHENGILHRDLSDGNILVEKDDHARHFFYFVDTNRIRVRKRLGLLRRIRNLIRLGIPPSHQRFFLERYFGSSPLKNSWFFWYRLNKIWYTASIGLKKMLRLKKLSRKLGMG